MKDVENIIVKLSIHNLAHNLVIMKITHNAHSQKVFKSW
jgi:hypothetical protein